MTKKKDAYVPTVGEEVANTVTHGVMSLLALVALPFAAVWAYAHAPDRILASVSVSIFVISIFLMFLASTPLVALIALGGVLYTLGAWFYARQGFRYHHMVWHLLINLAVAAHFTGIVFFLY